MLGSGTNFVATVIGFAMSVTFIIFVCTRIVCWRLRGGDSRPMFEIESRIDLEQELQPPHHQHRMNGLEPVVVAAIPTMKFTHEAFSSAEEAQCSICLGEYQEKEVLRIMPKCGHNFHLSCIDVWLRKQSTCPVCRFPVQQDSFEPKQHASFNSNLPMDPSEEHSRQWLLPVADPSLTNNVSSSGSSSRGHSNSVPRDSNQELAVVAVESGTRQHS